MAELAGLGNQFPRAMGVTLDLGASLEVGAPVVVLRPAQMLPAATLLGRLSAREQDVARLLGEGLRNREIAVRLGIGLGTVKDHVHHILQKTGTRTRAGLAAALTRSV